ncbi:hypothetical protein OP10G_1170 [Fimbriimonas ginsengisoli Gsoil 348]|uniref:Uncharacterized protein n=2 Tax=Fimbriimonas ginsengisoli TaxID=1005039 RepID=A0A068NLY3_FIMGI|nr:hypothetical protein OP10G_1170 [Fimbriimonas ginsengisoli Gsoil 348]
MGMVREMECPTCKVAMIPGRRRDKGDGMSASQEAWLAGDPRPEVPFFGNFTGFGRAFLVTTHACPRCGLLLSYVDPSSLQET